MKKYSKQIICAFLALCLAAACAFSGCASSAKPNGSDILTQKPIEKGRKPVTVLVKYAFTINTFEAMVEEKFPDIDIVQVGNYTYDMGISEYEARLEHDDLPDIVMTWPLDVGEEYWSERLLDLSALDFTSSYNLSMLNTIERDGSLYYLPGPAQVRGIVYNKTLFEEKGWQVPKSFEEFVALCKTIEASGMRSLQLGLGNAEVLDTAFVGYGYADCFSSPQDTQWLKDYNAGQGKFADHFLPALENFQTLIDSGVLRENDLNIKYSDREKMLFNRECAMVEDSVLLARMGEGMTGSTDEFALMPFFNPNNGGDWARLYMVCYIGVNKHVAEPENKDMYDRVMQVMEYISTPEGQEALMGDTGAMYSSLKGVDPPTVPEIEALVPALKSGRYAIFPQLANAQHALRTGLAGMVRGEMTPQLVCTMVDEQNAEPPAKSPPRVLGTAKTDFTIEQTGSFVTDCMRDYSGCELALFLDNGKDGRYNGQGISARLYAGEVTNVDVARLLPDLKAGQTGVLWKGSMTGESLLQTLEYAIPVNNNETGWFYYFSGLQVQYDLSAEPGSRVKSIRDANGKAIDPAREYTVAVMDGTVPEEFLLTCEKTDDTITEIVEQAVVAQKTIQPASDYRFESVHS